MIAVHNHPGYSNCPKCVARILEIEAELADTKALLNLAVAAQDALKKEIAWFKSGPEVVNSHEREDHERR